LEEFLDGKLLILGLRHKLLNWFETQVIKVEILGEFDDTALMKAFRMYAVRSSLRRRCMCSIER